MLFELAASTQQYAKAIEYGKQVADAGSRRRRMTWRSWRSSTTSRRTARTRPFGRDKAIAAARKAGEAPKENLYPVQAAVRLAMPAIPPA